jgi:hypothetical protein
VDHLSVTDGTNIRIGTATVMETTALDRGEVVVHDEMMVRAEREVDLIKVSSDSRLLPRRNAKDVRESTS